MEDEITSESEEIVGVFIGLQSSNYEYIATIIAPYKADFSIELGSFLLIYDEPFKLVSRVIDFVPQGELTSFMGQKWLSDVAFDAEAIGSDIKKRKISYSVKIKILGTLDSKNAFIPGLRKIPHITSRVIKPDSAVVARIINQVMQEQTGGSKVGDYFLDPEIEVKFDPKELLEKRTFVFARAGYGKSNLMKILASDWKEEYGSLVVFDPDGEYAVTDKKGRPGLMDRREAILVTNRREPEIRNVYRNLRVNLKHFEPEFVLPLIIPPEKQEFIFFQKLMGLSQDRWNRLVDLFYERGWTATLEETNMIIGAADTEEAEMRPVRNNLIYPIRTLHDPNSHLMRIIETAIERGLVVVVDVSRLNSLTALRLTSIILQRVFNENQRNFIAGSPDELMRATFVVDEAQSVLSRDSSYESFVTLAKEGRKYSLGAVFITQQPGSIPFEILSQGDNFFVFHLLSRGDLDSLQRANAHYSNDIITQALNEPKKGKCYMWTSSQPFVLPVQILNFEDQKISNRAREVQANSTLLSSILQEITEEFESPAFRAILRKHTEVEEVMVGAPINQKTMALFQKLNDEERGYVRTHNGLQMGPLDKKEFAITFRYYHELSTLNDALHHG